MQQVEFVIYVLVNLASLAFFAVAVYRYRRHKMRYPLAEKNYQKLLKSVKNLIIILSWFAVLMLISLYFGYLIFIKY